MKKLKSIQALLLALILCVSLAGGVRAENGDDAAIYEPHFVHVHYTEETLHGIVDAPSDGPYFVRVTFILPTNTFFVIVTPVKDWEFCIRIACVAEYVAMELVDRQDAFCPGTYTAYDAIGIHGLRELDHPPNRW